MMDELVNFRKNLKQIMQDLGVSQIELSKRTGLTPACISQILNNGRDPNLKSIIKILRVIPIKFENLIKGEL